MRHPIWRSLIVGFFLLLCVRVHPGLAQTAIIEKGQAKATIYFESQAAASVRLAASELQAHLRLMTGVNLPVTSDLSKAKGYVIYLGGSPFATRQGLHYWQLPPDGYRIMSGKDWLLIAGNDYSGPPLTGFENPWRYHESFNTRLQIGAFGDSGTLFGVYHFLERYGVRWYMPGRLGTVIPTIDTVTVPILNISKAPWFEQRHAYYGFMDRSEDDTLWYRRAGYGSARPVVVTHSFGHYFIKYKDSHPEYFALIDGKRDFTNLSSADGNGNLNLSNPGLIQQAIDDIIKYFDENPNEKIFSLSPPDGMTRISEDAESQAQIDKTRGFAGEFSNYVFGFVNKVAIGVARKYPQKFIGCLAYSRHQLPPSNIEKLNPNVLIVVCKFRAMFADPAKEKEGIELFDAWSAKAKTLYRYEYYCPSLFDPRWQQYPMFFSRMLQEDMQRVKYISKGEFIEAESWAGEDYATAPQKIRIGQPGMQHPLLYLTARLLWDPDLDVTSLLDEYYRVFYGPAEAPMRDFWQLVESNWMAKKGFPSAPPFNPARVYDQATIDRLQDCLKRARDKTPAESIYRQRVELIASELVRQVEK